MSEYPNTVPESQGSGQQSGQPQSRVPQTPPAQQPYAQQAQPNQQARPAQQHYAQQTQQTQPTHQQYAQQTQQTPPAQQTPPRPSFQNGAGSQVPPVPPTGSPQAAPGAPAPKPHHKTGHLTLKAVIFGLIGGLVSSGALVGTLFATGILGSGETHIVSSDGVQEITIDPNDDDITVANAVAAKALPSVATIYCTFPEGEGMGSGVIYDTEGNIITNNHVIENAESISVTYNGKSYDATLVGTDPSSDVAVVHVDFGGDPVTPMEVGDSAALQVGDWVMSVGSPFGLENSVSQGIVSALSRNTLLENSSGNTLYTNLIQTDATINPGNSGGALVNDEGKLVGICTLFSSDTESFAGIGYAIPGNYATQVADKIIAGETVTHAYIGLTMQTVTPQNALRNNLSVDSGAFVVEVAEDGPAAAAGIQAGDVITSIGGQQIASADSAILAVRSFNIGDVVEVKAMRGDQEMTFEVALGSDEALQQEQQEQRQETVDINGQDVSMEDLIRLYEQYQYQQQMDPFGGM